MTAHTFTNGITDSEEAATGNVADQTADIPPPRTPREDGPTLDLAVTYPERSTALVKATGDIDICTAPRLQELLHCRLRSQLRVLILNLSDVSFLSIGAAQMLARAAAYAHYNETELHIITVGSRSVRRTLLASGLEQQLPIERD